MSSVLPPNVDDLQAAGAVGYAAWLYAHGYDDDQVDEALYRRFPAAATVSRIAARNRGLASWLAARDLTIPGGSSLTARDVPGPRGDPFNYRYYGVLELLDARGTPAGAFPFALEGLPLLSQDELRVHVEALYAAHAATLTATSRGRYDLAPDLVPGDMEVISVERR